VSFIDDMAKAARDWTEKSDDDVSPDQMNDALVKAGLAEPTEEKPRALFHDPYSVMDWGGWRQRPSALTYDTLRQMSVSNTVIAAIIQLRVDQVSQFAVPQQGDYDKGFRIILRDRRDRKKKMTKVQQKRATELERMLETTGYLLPDERHYDRDSFRTFLKKSIRDVMTYDQMCFEKLRDRKGRPSRFHVLPAETIRPAVADVEHMDPAEARNRVAYVQVYEESVIAEFGPDDLAWCIKNPRSDLRVNGFGFSPIEMVVRLVTSWLFGFEYNTKFFTQGSAIKGLINIKGAIPDRQLRAFRRMWYCLSGDSVIATDFGFVALRDLVGRDFRVWDGAGHHKARAVATGEREIAVTKLSNGAELRTSPEHRFRVIRDGRAGWYEQRELVQGDTVLLAPFGDTPDELDYPTASVVEAWQTGQREEMFDIEVFNDRHLFFANGIAVHNSQVSGVQNAWKTPILNSEDIQWHSLHSTNKEMEFSNWMDWLTRLILGIFGVDGAEIGFHFGSGTGNGGGMFASRPNKAEITESKDKGLNPLVQHIADSINRHIIWELEPDFEFAFTGLDAKAEEKTREARNVEVRGWRTVNQILEEQDLDPLPGNMGDVILDPTYLQWASQQQAQEQEAANTPPSGGPLPDNASDPTQNEMDQGMGVDGAGPQPAAEGAPGASAGEGMEQPAKEAMAASLAVIRTVDELRKAERERRVDGDRQILEIELPGES
jgi:hypothetical protein